MNIRLKINPKKCSGCRLCEMACSIQHLGVVNTGRSAIRIYKDDLETGANTCIDRATFGETRIRQGTNRLMVTRSRLASAAAVSQFRSRIAMPATATQTTGNTAERTVRNSLMKSRVGLGTSQQDWGRTFRQCEVEAFITATSCLVEIPCILTDADFACSRVIRRAPLRFRRDAVVGI